MKTWITVLCAVALLTGCATNKPAAEAPKVVVDGHQLQFRGDFAYFEGQRFTGVAVKKYPNGQKKTEATFKDGNPHGLWTEWYENGQKEGEMTYKDGKPHGLMTLWYENGQKSSERSFKDGEEIYFSSKNWDEDGNPTDFYGNPR